MSSYYKEKVNTYYELSRVDLIEFIPKNVKTVLDVGCSNGNFGKMLKDNHGAQEVWGIEPFEDAAKYAGDKIDKLFTLPVEVALDLLGNKKFDCIFFNDVFEHLVDPYTILSKVKGHLTDSGVIFASIPNILQLETLYKIVRTRDWKYESWGIMDKTHLRFFTKNSIKRMFDEAGYTIKSIQGINPIVKRKFRIARFFLGKRMEDFKYVQFVVIATKN